MSKSGIMSKSCKNMANNNNCNKNRQLNEKEIKMENNFIETIKNVCETNKNKNIMLLDNIDLTYYLTNKNNITDSRIFMLNENNNCTKIIVQTPDFQLSIPFNLDNIEMKPINFVQPINPLKYENLINMNLFDEITIPNSTKSNENINNDFMLMEKEEMDTKKMINNEKADNLMHLEKTKQTKNAIKKLKRKNRSMSESDCDVINKVTDHFSELNIIQEERMDNYKNAGQKKIRSFSESGHDDNSTKIHKFRGILKHTVYNRSISEENNDYNDDYEAISFSDSKLNENSKKSVRFNEVIRKQLFRVNSSILGQKKKNLRKKRSRKLSETENSPSDGEENLKYAKNMDNSNRNI